MRRGQGTGTEGVLAQNILLMVSSLQGNSDKGGKRVLLTFDILCEKSFVVKASRALRLTIQTTSTKFDEPSAFLNSACNSPDEFMNFLMTEALCEGFQSPFRKEGQILCATYDLLVRASLNKVCELVGRDMGFPSEDITLTKNTIALLAVSRRSGPKVGAFNMGLL